VAVRLSLGQKRLSFAKTGSGRPATNCRKETARRRRRRRNKRRRRRQKIARGDPPRDEEIQGRACRQKRPSFNFSCGLSRACLGKYSVCSIKWHRNKRRAPLMTRLTSSGRGGMLPLLPLVARAKAGECSAAIVNGRTKYLRNAEHHRQTGACRHTTYTHHARTHTHTTHAHTTYTHHARTHTPHARTHTHASPSQVGRAAVDVLATTGPLR
jgi:hypothetical protein